MEQLRTIHEELRKELIRLLRSKHESVENYLTSSCLPLITGAKSTRIHYGSVGEVELTGLIVEGDACFLEAEPVDPETGHRLDSDAPINLDVTDLGTEALLSLAEHEKRLADAIQLDPSILKAARPN